MIDPSLWYLKTPIAHRGLHSKDIPENSLKAFEKAIESGFSIELDIRLLKDGELVVFHDKNLSRLTASSLNIESCNWNEISHLCLNGSEEKIPRLLDVLNYVEGRTPLVIELKNEDHSYGHMEKVIYEALKSYKGEFSLQSFNPLSLLWFRRNAPEIVLGLLVGDLKKGNLSLTKKLIIENLLFLPVIRPSYIGGEWNWSGRRRLFWARHFFDIPIIGWTFRDLEDFNFFGENFDNIIFEGFIPR